MRADTQSLKQQQEDKRWRCAGVMIFIAIDCMSLPKLAEVVATCHKDGDMEHTQKKYMKMTHSCERIGLCYATAKFLQRGRKNKVAVECAAEKIFPYEKTATRRCSKNAQRRKIARN